MTEINLGSGAEDWSSLDALVDVDPVPVKSESPKTCAGLGPSEVKLAEKPPGAVGTEPRIAARGSVPTGRHTATGYQFPIDDPNVARVRLKFASRPTDELLNIFESLLQGSDKLTGKTLAYSKIRHFVVAISMLLNERKDCPPRFRPSRTRGYKSIAIKWNEDESTLSNDRQVIDLHWLWCSGADLKPRRKWRGLFSEDGMQFDLASQFVATVGTPESKIGELGIHRGEMVQLAVLQTAELRQRWGDIHRRSHEERGQLRNWLEDHKKRTTATCDDLVIQFEVLGLVGQNFSEAARLAGLVLGSTISSKTMQRRFELFQGMGLLRKSKI